MWPNSAPQEGPHQTPNNGAGRDWDTSFNRQQGVCNNWRREGRCAFGDRCKFQHDLRIDNDVRQDVEGSEKQLPSTPEEKQQQHRWTSVPDNQRPWREREGPKEYYKTKLCEKFMGIGRCPYDERCTYAHGYEELRTYPRHPSTMESGVLTETGDKEASESLSVTSEKQRLSHSQSEAMPYQQVAEISYLDKVKAICSFVGIGNAGPVKNGAVQEAMADVKSREMLKGNVYAHDVQSFV